MTVMRELGEAGKNELKQRMAALKVNVDEKRAKKINSVKENFVNFGGIELSDEEIAELEKVPRHPTFSFRRMPRETYKGE